MPYIAPENRKKLDPLIDRLAEQIAAETKTDKQDGAFAGLLNYVCTRLALKVVKNQFGKIRYWLIAVISGVFKNVGDEFYRRLASSYEDRQIIKKGDVDLYREFLKEIKKK